MLAAVSCSCTGCTVLCNSLLSRVVQFSKNGRRFPGYGGTHKARDNLPVFQFQTHAVSERCGLNSRPLRMRSSCAQWYFRLRFMRGDGDGDDTKVALREDRSAV